jgi:hypothetical protein
MWIFWMNLRTYVIDIWGQLITYHVNILDESILELYVIDILCHLITYHVNILDES